jgi:hypothetical protein
MFPVNSSSVNEPLLPHQVMFPWIALLPLQIIFPENCSSVTEPHNLKPNNNSWE